MPILPAPAGYTAIRLSGNYQNHTGAQRVIPSGSYVYVPTARASAFCAASGSTIVNTEPTVDIYWLFGDGTGKWDGC